MTPRRFAILAVICFFIGAALALVLFPSKPAVLTPAAIPTPTRKASTREPTPKPTVVLHPTPTIRFDYHTILYQDDFGSAQDGWPIVVDDKGSGYSDLDKYRLKVTENNYLRWANPQLSFSDISVAVDTELVAGNDKGIMGVICRYKNSKNFVYAIYSLNGNYGIARFKDDQHKVLTSGTGLYRANVLTEDKSINRIQLICNGTRYTLLINGQQIDSATDDSFSNGDVGLLVGTEDAPLYLPM